MFFKKEALEEWSKFSNPERRLVLEKIMTFPRHLVFLEFRALPKNLILLFPACHVHSVSPTCNRKTFSEARTFKN